LLLLSCQSGFLAAEEGLVVARPIEQAAAVDLQDARGQLAEEHPVVRDENQRCGPTQQKVLQPLDRSQIEMVRRLVEQ
jgi:hypothetical protein